MRIVITPHPHTIGPKPCPVYVKSPWIRNGKSEAFEKLIDQATRHAYPMCQTRVCFFSKQAFPPCLEDSVPAHHKSNVIYSFTCRYGCRYVCKTTQRLEARIKQHIPAYLYKPGNQKNPPASAIGEHLAANTACLDAFNYKQFTIPATARNQSKLDTLEALFIKKLTSDSCKQKEFVTTLHLF